MTDHKRSSRGPWALAIEELLRDHTALGGGTVVLILIGLAFVAPYIAPYDPARQDLLGALQPPSYDHLMGTDAYGRDVFSRLLFGAGLSLSIGFVSVGIAVAAGLPIGLAAGYYGGRFEGVVMRAMDVILAFPGLLLILVVVAILGTGLINAMIAIGIASVPIYVRIVRASTISAMEEDYVTASRSIGCSPVRIMRVHLLPNILSPLLVVSTLRLATTILTGATLGFLAPVITRIASALVDAGLVERRTPRSDRRAVLLVLTRTGRRRARAMRRDLLRAAAEVLEPLNLDKRESVRAALCELQVLLPAASTSRASFARPTRPR